MWTSNESESLLDKYFQYRNALRIHRQFLPDVLQNIFSTPHPLWRRVILPKIKILIQLLNIVKQYHYTIDLPFQYFLHTNNEINFHADMYIARDMAPLFLHP